MAFKHTVTIYNSYEQDFKDILVPKLMNGVHAEVTRGAGQAAEGDNNSSRLFVLIPFKGFKNGYRQPQEYCSAQDKSDIWTLAPGDIITVGNTEAADSFSELAEKADVFRITEIKVCDYGSIPHWEVTAL